MQSLKRFLKSVLEGMGGGISSKRVALFILLFLFVGVVIYNLITGKNLDPTLKDQLFYLNCWIFSMVFGERFIDIFGTKNPLKTT